MASCATTAKRAFFSHSDFLHRSWRRFIVCLWKVVPQTIQHRLGRQRWLRPPATKKLRKIKRIGRWYSDTTGLLRVYIIATSTPALKNSIRLLSHATGDSGRHSRTSGTSVPVMARGDPLAQGLHIRWTEARGHCVRHTLHHRAIVRSSGLRGPGRPELTASMTEACRPVARRHRIAL